MHGCLDTPVHDPGFGLSVVNPCCPSQRAGVRRHSLRESVKKGLDAASVSLSMRETTARGWSNFSRTYLLQFT